VPYIVPAHTSCLVWPVVLAAAAGSELAGVVRCNRLAGGKRGSAWGWLELVVVGKPSRTVLEILQARLELSTATPTTPPLHLFILRLRAAASY
jgi:hypothetical protein